MAISLSTAENRNYSLDEAFEYCAAVTNAHYENFPVASLFLPQEKRPYIQSIYAFSRIADDIADESVAMPEERLTALNSWEDQLLRCYEGKAEHPVFIALKETTRQLNIPVEPLRDLLTAFKQDVVKFRYDTFEDLLAYCRCSANPVGRLILMIFGYRDAECYKLSDSICTGLQLANFWQDLSVDVQKDRLYIPLEDMNRFGYTVEEWKQRRTTPKLNHLIEFQTDRTKQLFYEGSPLLEMVDRDLQLELKLVWLGGMGIVRKIERINYDVMKRRPTLSAMGKVMIFMRALFMKHVSWYGRKHPLWDPE